MLTDKQIEDIALKYTRMCGGHWPYEEAIPKRYIVDFARAIEKAVLFLDLDKCYGAYHELKDAAIALVQRLELDKDVKKNNWWLNERAKIMEVIDDNKEL